MSQCCSGESVFMHVNCVSLFCLLSPALLYTQAFSQFIAKEPNVSIIRLNSQMTDTRVLMRLENPISKCFWRRKENAEMLMPCSVTWLSFLIVTWSSYVFSVIVCVILSTGGGKAEQKLYHLTWITSNQFS